VSHTSIKKDPKSQWGCKRRANTSGIEQEMKASFLRKQLLPRIEGKDVVDLIRLPQKRHPTHNPPPPIRYDTRAPCLIRRLTTLQSLPVSDLKPPSYRETYVTHQHPYNMNSYRKIHHYPESNSRAQDTAPRYYSLQLQFTVAHSIIQILMPEHRTAFPA